MALAAVLTVTHLVVSGAGTARDLTMIQGLLTQRHVHK